MKFHFIIKMLTACILHGSSYALDLPNLPFSFNKAHFKIELSSNKTLLKSLEEELKQQRKNNRILQQFSKSNKIMLYESQLLTSRLRAEGYYASKINTTMQDHRVTYRIDPGPIYRVQKLILQFPDSIDVPKHIITLKSGDPLRAELVLTSKKALTSYIIEKYCLYTIDVNYHVVVEHQTQSALLRFTVEDSPSMHFGEISFAGLKSIDEDYLRTRLLIKKGDCYKPSSIDSARITLIQTNLLASVTPEILPPQNDYVPIVLHIVERHHHRVSVGFGFESNDGLGLSMEWEHRNLLGRGQKLIFDSHLTQNTQALTSKLTFPHFRHEDSALTFYTDLEQRNTDAFQSKIGALGIETSYKFMRHFRGSIISELAFSHVEEDGILDTFALMSLSLNIEYDRRNDPLDPLYGWVVAGNIRPYWDAYNTDVSFVKSMIAASTYYTFNELLGQPTVAIRSAIGMLSGATHDQIPANVRFYTGGGGSVRGYSFQTLGPLTNKEPDGGLSFTELSFETRFRWGQQWGGVFFLDGGFSYQDRALKFGQGLHWGAGLGLRYYTSFAPIRFDVAVPLDKRENIDDSFNFYISIGQSF